MSTTDSINSMSSCANCGKGEEDSDNLKTCNGCKMVKYCNAGCQKAHRPQHKGECKKRAVELHNEALFKQPPPNEECPICMIHDSPTLTCRGEEVPNMLRSNFMLWMHDSNYRSSTS